MSILDGGASAEFIRMASRGALGVTCCQKEKVGVEDHVTDKSSTS